MLGNVVDFYMMLILTYKNIHVIFMKHDNIKIYNNNKIFTN